MRTALNVLCWFTAAACAWLAVMFVVLHRPGFERGLAVSVLLVVQSLFTLSVMHRILRAAAWRVIALGAAIGSIAIGVAAVANTLTGTHFEGFALIIGAALVVQGVGTTQQLITKGFTGSSEVHQFGN